jgi:hypothetical protein
VHFPTSLNSKGGSSDDRMSETPIRAMTPGNAWCEAIVPMHAKADSSTDQ